MLTDRPKRRADVSSRDVDEDTVVLDRATDRIHRLNATASFIWHRCDGRRTVDEIVHELTGFFDVETQAANDAVIGVIAQLDQLGLLDRTQR